MNLEAIAIMVRKMTGKPVGMRKLRAAAAGVECRIGKGGCKWYDAASIHKILAVLGFDPATFEGKG